MEIVGVEPRVRSPYEEPELYDLMLDALEFDLPFWKQVAKEGGGPVLDVGCGTGRVLLRLLEAGCDADGLDNAPAMLERARQRAKEQGFAPRLTLADMRDFRLERRYARAICAFNAFAHCETTDDQIAALAAIRRHLEPGGALVMHMSYPRPGYWTEPDGVPVLELEITHPVSGHRVQMWDTRLKDPVAQRQRSRMEIRELTPEGETIASHHSETTQRWVYPFELDLLMRAAGYARREIFGGFEREPLTRPEQQMVAWGWNG